jgi:peptidyl-prolyl cis-trans isomerase B (cyclophilin B)
MARTQVYDSASSQFFICYDDSCTFLDGQYAAFGEVTEGMDVVDNFLKVERSYNSSGVLAIPNTPITMETVVMIEDDENGNPRVQVTMNDFLSK